MTTRHAHYPHRDDPCTWDQLYGEELVPYAWQTFRGFAGMVYDAVVRRGECYDLLLASGNSGSGMLRLCRIVLAEAGLDPPPSLLLSLQRPRGVTRQAPVSPVPLSVIDERAAAGRLAGGADRLLFVDDEISHAAWTLRSSVAAYQRRAALTGDKGPCTVMAVAEDQGYGDDPLPNVSFMAFSCGVPGLFNTIFHVSWGVGLPVLHWLLRTVGAADAKQVFGILLGVPMRDSVRPDRGFSLSLARAAYTAVPGLASIAMSLRAELGQQARQAFSEVERETLRVIPGSAPGC